MTNMGEQGMNVCAVCNCFNLPHFTPADLDISQYLPLVYTFWANPVSPYFLTPCSPDR